MLSPLTATATFACGCFWSKQYFFDRLTGVRSTRVGFTGGHVPDVDYRQVCTKTTGHAEAVEVRYNPDQLSYQQLLEAFFGMHDATVDRRAKGGQYRSAIFYHTMAQRDAAMAYVDRLAAKGIAVSTEIVPATAFWPAGKRHQGYCAVRGMTPSVKGVTG